MRRRQPAGRLTPACAAHCGAAGAASNGAPRCWCCRCSRSSSCASWRRSARCWRAGLSTPTSRAFCPRVTAALRDWDGRGLPPEKAYAALVRDIRAAREAGTLASAATRLNYDVAGLSHAALRHGRPASPARSIGIRARPSWSASIRNGAERETLGRDPPRRRSAHRFLPARARSIFVAMPTTRSSARRPSRRYSATCSAARCGFRASSRSICLLLGYPVALFIARQPPQRAALLLFLVLLPFWTSLLVRTVAWVVLLQTRGHPEQPLPVARHRQRAAPDDLQPLRRLRRDGARAAAVHGAAALRSDERHLAVVSCAPRRRSARRRGPHSARLPAADDCPASPPAA